MTDLWLGPAGLSPPSRILHEAASTVSNKDNLSPIRTSNLNFCDLVIYKENYDFWAANTILQLQTLAIANGKILSNYDKIYHKIDIIGDVILNKKYLFAHKSFNAWGDKTLLKYIAIEQACVWENYLFEGSSHWENYIFRFYYSNHLRATVGMMIIKKI